MRKSCQKTKLSMILIVATLLGIIACSGELLDSRNFQSYELRAVILADQNNNLRSAAAQLWRDDSVFTEADLLFDDNLMAFNSSAFGLEDFYSGTDTDLSAGVIKIDLIDSSKSFELTTTMPENFSILTIEPPNRQLQGAGPVTLEWSPSLNTDRYVIAAVKATKAYTGQGYSAYPDGGTAGTIPTDAFIEVGTPNPDTGLYNIYVYAISGAPDSALASALLPTPLPNQAPNNIAQSKLTGRLGSVQVLLRDTVRVVTLP